MPEMIMVRGVPASPGVATGPTKIIIGLDDFQRFNVGDVLVCRATSPAWMPLLARASAVVTEIGGILSHAAIVAREYGVPAVVGAQGAMDTLSDQQLIMVDGFAGTVSAVASGSARA